MTETNDETEGSRLDPEQYNKAKLKGGQMVAAMLAANPGARHSYGVTAGEDGGPLT